LYDIIIKKDYKYLTEVLNNCILYCYNSKPKNLFSFTIFKSKSNTQISKESHEKQNNDTISHNNNNSRNKNIPPIPFIRTSMKKKFCLVLDIDETISHSLKLSFGYYFLVRPGAIYFLKEVSKYYEIIIFTSSPKNYADNILNKIDISRNLISHRLYRNHVVYENGKSVKNLNKLGRDLTKTIFIDNLRTNAKYNLNNLCSITTWISDIFDDKLIKLKEKLIYIATCGKYDDDITQGI
jgi:Dullard-like phosphatase family protein